MTEPDPSHRLKSARVALERLRSLRATQGSAAPPQPLFASTTSSTAEHHTPTSPEHLASRDAHLAHLMRAISPLITQHPDHKGLEPPPLHAYDRVHAFGISRDGAHIMLAHQHAALLFNHQDKLPARGQVELQELPRRAAISRDGRRIALLTGFEQLLLIEQGVGLRIRQEIIVEGMWPGNSQLTFSSDGQRIAISDDDQVNLYRWDDGALLHKWAVDGQQALEFAPTPNLLFASGLKHTHILQLDSAPITLQASAVAFSPDGQLAALLQDAQITIGRPRAVTPTWTWQPGERSIKLPHAPDHALNLMRFSPDQRWLFVGSSSGGWHILDLERHEWLTFEDVQRSQQRQHVKILEVGFSPDSSRLLLHATLSPDAQGSDPLGAVLSWSLPRGRFLGSILWIGNAPHAITAQGFYAPLQELGARSFSSNTWQRPDLVVPLLAGRDAADLLTTQERAALDELELRSNAMIGAAHAMPAAFTPREATSALRHTAAIALAVFQDADRRALRATTNTAPQKPYIQHLHDAAFALEVEHSAEERLTMHRELLAALPTAPPPPPHSTPQRATTADSHGDPMIATPGTISATREARPGATARHGDPNISGPSELRGNPQLTRVMHGDPALHAQQELQPTHAQEPLRWNALVICAAIGFGLVFAFFAVSDASQLPTHIFWGALIGIGPLLTIILYHGIGKHIGGK